MAGEIYPMPGKARSDVVVALGGTLVLALVLFRLSYYAPVAPVQPPSSSGAQLTPATASVEILAPDDPSLGPALTEVEAMLSGYGGRLRVDHYNPATEPGASFAHAKGIGSGAGLVIFVNGTQTFTVDGEMVTFESRAGSPRSWSVEQLATVLQRVLGE
jgi:hypothetical protein